MISPVNEGMVTAVVRVMPPTVPRVDLSMQSKLSNLVLCLSMMDLRRLAVFREVAERGSFSGAALELDYTQSVVSHHVAQLERQLGVTLLERGRRPVRLTPAGERLHAHAGDDPRRGPHRRDRPARRRRAGGGDACASARS